LNRSLLVVIGLVAAVAAAAAFAVLKSDLGARPPEASLATSQPALPPPGAGHLMMEAAQLDASRQAGEAKRMYERIAREHSSNFFGQIAQTRLAEIGLEGYFESLDDSNSVTYVVQYGDTLDRIARQYGITPGLIRVANNLPSDVIRPNQNLKIMKEKWSLVADKTTNILQLKAGDRVVKTYPIGTGKGNSTPVGRFTIVNRLKNPTWYYQGTVAPPGSPDNPLGTRWMGFDIESYGLHGTTDPDSIGQSKSLGCIRMLNPDVEELFEIIPVGTPITVTESARLAVGGAEAPAAGAPAAPAGTAGPSEGPAAAAGPEGLSST
jgi:lipoprotein-anchoring transpeptidase ErfK/SrfK